MHLLQELGNLISEFIIHPVYTHCSEMGILLISQARLIDDTDLNVYLAHLC